MTKYNEYRSKALQLDRLIEVLTAKHIRVQTVALGGHVVRVTKDKDRQGVVVLELLER